VPGGARCAAATSRPWIRREARPGRPGASLVGVLVGVVAVERTERRGELRHLDRHARRVGALLGGTDLGLLVVLGGEHGVGDRDPELERDARDAGRALVRDDLEVIRLAADHAADRDQRVEFVGLREPLQRQRNLERARHRADEDVLLGHPELEQLGQARLAQRDAHGVVEARLHDAHAQALAIEFSAENLDRHLSSPCPTGSNPETSRS
jgi:hypothetical protein